MPDWFESYRKPRELFVDELLTFNAMAALATLSILEIVLGIDNIVFLAILTGKLPEAQQGKARTLGLTLAAAGRIALLLAITWVISLDKNVLFELPFDLPGGNEGVVAGGESHVAPPPAKAGSPTANPFAGRTPITAKDLVLLLGGIFLIGKATWEIGHQMEPQRKGSQKVHASLPMVLAQIVMIDLVFSLDSVLTAVGMVRPDDYKTRWVPLAIMVTAVLLSIGVMIAFSGPIARFVNRHLSVKMLALSFLILIGVVLVAESLHTHIPRGYIYFSMTFSLMVEVLNLRSAARVMAEKESAAAI